MRGAAIRSWIYGFRSELVILDAIELVLSHKQSLTGEMITIFKTTRSLEGVIVYVSIEVWEFQRCWMGRDEGSLKFSPTEQAL